MTPLRGVATLRRGLQVPRTSDPCGAMMRTQGVALAVPQQVAREPVI